MFVLFPIIEFDANLHLNINRAVYYMPALNKHGLYIKHILVFLYGMNVWVTHWGRVTHISRVSCQKGPTRHAHAWQIGPFWQDTLDICQTVVGSDTGLSPVRRSEINWSNAGSLIIGSFVTTVSLNQNTTKWPICIDDTLRGIVFTYFYVDLPKY